MVYIIDHSGTRIINKFVIPSVPHQIVAVGAYDVDYSIYVATRNNTIYTIHNGEVSLNTKIEVGNSIVSMIKTDKSLLITTINCLYHSYNTNSGKKNFSICMPSTIICMEMFESKKGNFKAAMIALRNFEIRMYSEKNLINVLTLNENIFGLKFGRFGKEEESLVILTDTGSLLIKSLSSTVNIESLSYSESKRNMEEINLNVPKKTKLYLDLIEREKECAGNMNQVFQSDLAKIKYKAMDTFVKMLKIGNAPQNYNSTTNVKVSASFQGLGPNFKLNLIVDNGGDELIYGADLILDYERSIFSFEKENIQLGVIMPKVPMRYSLKFKNISERGASGLIKIIILDKTSPTPLVQSTLKVPISELEIL